MIKSIRFVGNATVPIVLALSVLLPGCRPPVQSNMGAMGTQSNSVTRTAAFSVKNLKEIGRGIAMYRQDWDDSLPPLLTNDATQNALKVYVKQLSVFITPDTFLPYIANVALSGKKVASITNPAGCVLFYEPEPMSDGTRAVAYVDGHVLRIPEAEWTKLKADQQIP